MGKKRKPIPYTLKTKELFRDAGYLVEDMERVNCWSGTRNDGFGFTDLIAIKIGKPVLLIQSTSGTNHTARRKKILGLKTASYCLKAGLRIVVVSWKKVRNRWVPRVEEILLTSF